MLGRVSIDISNILVGGCYELNVYDSQIHMLKPKFLMYLVFGNGDLGRSLGNKGGTLMSRISDLIRRHKRDGLSVM